MTLKMRNSNNKCQCEAVKLVMLGASGVGKSALVVRYLTRRFIWEYDPTLECSYKHETTVDEEPAHVEILDTAGLHNTASHTEAQVRWGDGFILVYSITDRGSFNAIDDIKDVMEDIKAPRSPHFVLVGNKSDLVHDRQVSYEEGERLASQMGCGFFETSACDGGDIEEVFHEVYRDVRRQQMMSNKPRRRSSVHQQVSHVFNKMLTKIHNT